MHQQIGIAVVLALLAITISVKDPTFLLAGGGKPPVTLSLPSLTTVNPGDTFTLPISLDMEADSHAISTVTLVLTFDPNVLTVTDFSPANVLPEVLESSVGTDTAGLTASSGTDSAVAIKSSTIVATITFQAVGSGGLSTPISFTRAEAYSLSAWDEASENVAGSTTDASITISGQPEAQPTITLDPTEGPSGTEVTATGSGWSAGDEVKVQWDDNTELTTTTVDDNGGFAVSFTVPETADEGEHTINFVGIPPDEGEEYSIPADFTVTVPAVTLPINDTTPGYYNNALGTILDETQPEFPPADSLGDEDPTIFPADEPDLSAASDILGDWLAPDPLPLNSNWSGLQSIPSTWQVNTETAIVYPVDAGSDPVANLRGNFGVDNGIFVWVNGEFRFGALAPGGVEELEYTDIDLGSLNPGLNYIQILREDHSVATGFTLEIAEQPEPEGED